jgi:hypothetical protein
LLGNALLKHVRGNEHAWRNESVAPRLTHVSETDETKNNRGNVRYGDLYPGRVEVINGSGFVNSRRKD